MTESKEKAFDAAMLNIYKRAWDEARYKARYFHQMLTEHRGLETARRLIHSPQVPEGYVELFKRGRLDLTMEALIHDNPEWQSLFSEEELEIVRKRLADYEYKPASKS